jgi:hypothetical protein
MLFGLLQQINHYQHRFQTNDQIVELFVPFAAFQNNEITFIHKDEIEWKGNKYDIKKIEFVKNGYNAIAILDKKEAKLFLFNAGGELLGAAPALLGAAVGDKDFEGVGNKTLSNIPPEQRITPAGRYVGWGGKYLGKGKYFWINYKAGLAIHAVVNPPGQRRLERIVSPDPREHRISWGCINVPTKFFNAKMRRVFAASNGIVYILPETMPASEFFGITAVN